MIRQDCPLRKKKPPTQLLRYLAACLRVVHRWLIQTVPTNCPSS